MAKKLKKRPVSAEPMDPNLEQVDEDRAFEIELDEESNEVVMVHHYRRMWGDGFNADVEHGLNIEEARSLVSILLDMITVMDQRAKRDLVEKATMEPIEGNPLQGPKRSENV